MNKEEKFLNSCINTVAGIDVNSENQAIAKEVVLSTIEIDETKIVNYKQALNEIREYANSDRLLKRLNEPKINSRGETHFDLIRQDILQIIDKVLGGSYEN